MAESRDLPFPMGSVVILKSGGPLMTVAAYPRFDPQIIIRCEWFDGATMCDGGFYEHSLCLVHK
jgi:uncharacterized protein YodC (DUF2158 family)